MIDSERGLGNGRVFPAGPLRAPLPPQLARTDALVVIGAGHCGDTVAARVTGAGKPVLTARLQPAPDVVSGLQGKPVLAFAGIGDPARFFRTLRASGIDVRREQAFADHHPFERAEVAHLVAEAGRQGLTLVTTEKDLVRLRSGPSWRRQRHEIVSFPVTLAFHDAASVRRLLTAACSRPARRNSKISAELEAGREAAAHSAVGDPCSCQPCVFSAPGKCRCSTAVGTA